MEIDLGKKNKRGKNIKEYCVCVRNYRRVRIYVEEDFFLLESSFYICDYNLLIL